jgi:hypothetical protein
MKKTAVAVVAALALLGGCTRNTNYGKCIGVQTEEVKTLNYDFSVKNIVIGLIFSETLIIPAIVILDDVKCPTGPSTAK